MKNNSHISRPSRLTPSRMPARLEGVVRNIGIKPRKKQKKARAK